MILGIPKPVCITYAANGPYRAKRDLLSLPLGAQELVEVVGNSIEAGASIFSFAPRAQSGQATLDPTDCQQLVETLKAETDGRIALLMEFDTCSGTGVTQFEETVKAAKPDGCQFRLDQILPRDGDEQDEEAARSLLEACEALGVGVQIVLTEPNDVDWFYAFRQYGIIPNSCRSLLLQLGKDGDEPTCEPHSLRSYLANLDKQHLLGRVAWTVAAFGPQETSALTAAMAFGGHIAPGFAYNSISVNGETYSSPKDHLLGFVDIAERLGRPTASAFEARTLLFGPR